MRTLTEDKSRNHDSTSKDEEAPVRCTWSIISSHEVIVIITCSMSHIILESRQSRERNTNEIHKVITSKSKRKRQGTSQDNHLKDIHLKGIKNLHHHGTTYEDIR